MQDFWLHIPMERFHSLYFHGKIKIQQSNVRIFEHTASSVDRVLDQIREDLQVWRAAGCVLDLTL